MKKKTSFNSTIIGFKLGKPNQGEGEGMENSQRDVQSNCLLQVGSI